MGFLSWDFEGWPVPRAVVARPEGMDREDPTARVRERRRRQLIDELLPKVRRLNPHWSDDELLEMAKSMAQLRLLNEEIG